MNDTDDDAAAEAARQLVKLQRRIANLEVGTARNDADLVQLKKKHPKYSAGEA